MWKLLRGYPVESKKKHKFIQQTDYYCMRTLMRNGVGEGGGLERAGWGRNDWCSWFIRV